MKKLGLLALLLIAGTLVAVAPKNNETLLQRAEKTVEKGYERAKQKVKSFFEKGTEREKFAEEGYPPELEDTAGGYAEEYIHVPTSIYKNSK